MLLRRLHVRIGRSWLILALLLLPLTAWAEDAPPARPVAAPLATVDVGVELPASTAAPQPRPDHPAFLTVAADLGLALGDAPVSRDGLGAALDALTGGDRGQRVFLRADKGVAYGEVMAVLNLLRGAGYLKVALVGLDAGPAAP